MRNLIALIIAVTVLAGCDKKNDEYAARPAAAGIVADENSRNAAIQAAGVYIDIMSPHTTSTSPWSFSASVAVGDQVSTIHMVQSTSPTVVQTGTVTIGTYQVQISGACANTQCNPYYFVATASLNGQAKIQVGYKFVRSAADEKSDVVHVVDGAHLLSFDNMVSVLNTK